MAGSTTRWLIGALALALVAAPVAAKPKPKPKPAAPAAESADDSADDSDDTAPAKKQAAPPDDGDQDSEDDRPAKRKASSDDNPSNSGLLKQDLSGHDLGTSKKENAFERDRFFVDKVDSDKTASGTLIQGSLTSTSFAYHESGGTLTAPVTPNPQAGPVPSASQFDRLYTDLRLQTDFRHIGSGKWDARVDVRGRVVEDPGITTSGYTPVTTATSQSGFLGKNELELKELWLVRNGVRSDVFFGRQFVPDLGGLKIDGLRVDYASSTKFTLLGFGGLYPIRGSRSVDTDYQPLLSNPDGTAATRSDAGRFTGTGGFGAAYRTLDSYGSFGGVVLAPLSSESPRVYGTSTGYWRSGPKLDFYHFAIIDLVGSNAVNAGLTNLSLGLNYKPDQRLRATLSFNRVDTETLNVQAQAFLSNPDNGANVIQNEAYLQRIATNEARASLSAGLGELQRFEITAAGAFRYRGDVTLTAPPGQVDTAGNAVTPLTVTLPAAESVEVYGSITDRHSVKDARLGLDASRIFGVGSATYQRTSGTTVRVSVAHDISNGRGEWEAEVAYSTTKDDSAGKTCNAGDLTTCFGAAQSSLISVGGNVYYRLNRDWFVMGSAFVTRNMITHVDMTASVDDPAVLGLTGFFRIAYRF